MRAWPVARSIFDAEGSERADNKLDNTCKVDRASTDALATALCVVITRRASALNVGQTMRATYSTQLATQPEARGISPLH